MKIKNNIILYLLALISNSLLANNVAQKNIDQCATHNKLEDLVPFIQYTKSNMHQWRPNPRDPNIYVSFSTEQFKEAYGGDQYADHLLYAESFGGGPAVDLSPEIIDKIRLVLEKEWITRAQIPLKFMPQNVDKEYMLGKNIYFMLGRKQKESVLKRKILTMPGLYPFNKNQLDNDEYMSRRTNYKVTKFPLFKSLGREERFIVLHESAHALIELKHFRKINKADTPPFKDDDNEEITCLDSVMAYLDDCPPLYQAINREKIDFNLLTEDEDILEKQPSLKPIIKRIQSAHPATLGPLDLEAARQFLISWRQRNEEELSLIVTSSASSSDSLILRTLRGLKEFYQDPIKFACEYALATAQECTGHFPHAPDGTLYTYWNSNNIVPDFSESEDALKARLPLLRQNQAHKLQVNNTLMLGY